MELVTVSPKFQVVVPKWAREQLHLEPGMKLSPIVWQGAIVYVRPKSLPEIQAMFQGLPDDFEREKSDRPL